MKYVLAIFVLLILVVGCKPSENTTANQQQISNAKPTANVEIIRFNAYPIYIAKGEDVVLTWNVIGAEEVLLDTPDSVRSVSSEDSLHVKPSNTATYLLVARKGADTISQTVNVEVSGGEKDNQLNQSWKSSIQTTLPQLSSAPTLPQISSDNLTSLVQYGDKTKKILGLFTYTQTENMTVKIENAYSVGLQRGYQQGLQQGYQQGYQKAQGESLDYVRKQHSNPSSSYTYSNPIWGNQYLPNTNIFNRFNRYSVQCPDCWNEFYVPDSIIIKIQDDKYCPRYEEPPHNPTIWAQ